MSEILRLEDVRKVAGEGEAALEVLKGVSLSVNAGEFVAIMGPSGSGKSSLLNIMGLLDRPTAGRVSLMGRDASTLEEDELAELRSRSIGFIFQNFHLLPYLTVAQNVLLPMEYARKPKDAARAEELLRRVGLTHRLGAYPPTLSGGEKQRAAIARALANEPALILADEPTGSLDAATGGQIMDFLGELHAAGGTIVLITHDVLVSRSAKRVVFITDGRVLG